MPTISEIKVGLNLCLPTVKAFCRLDGLGVVSVQLAEEQSILITAVVEKSKSGKLVVVLAADGTTITLVESGNQRAFEDKERVLKVDQHGRLIWLKHPLIKHSFPNNTLDEYASRSRLFQDQMENSFLFSGQKGSGDSKHANRLFKHQIGAIHAIGAHLATDNSAASLILPTGTGKTEIMLGAFMAYSLSPLLVVVPNKALRAQTAKKFEKLGLLRKLGHLSESLIQPVVGVLTQRIRDENDLQIFNSCNVVLASISTIAHGTSGNFLDNLQNHCKVLFIDEAHHIPAKSWSELKNSFREKPIFQFTATPFRRDKKLLEGRRIFEYSLGDAQENGFFKQINFEAVDEFDVHRADEAIASRAIEILRKDLQSKKQHILMARCAEKERAEAVFNIYKRIAADLNPILVHSGLKDSHNQLKMLLNRKSRIVICVDMLGEGFDLPELKIGALHDSHKSLAVFLQFIGRFTRSSGEHLGNATIVANTANKDVSASFEELFCENADWNHLLKGFASEAISDYSKTLSILEECEKIELNLEKLRDVQLSPSALYPKYSSVVFRSKTFRPLAFAEGLSKERTPHFAWHNKKLNLLIVVTAENPRLEWTRAKGISELHWDIYLLYHNSKQELLFVHSSDKGTLHFELAKAVSEQTAKIMDGEPVFRVFSGITRPLLQIVGLKKRTKGNIRFSQHMGADVKEALTSMLTSGAIKSNISGSGYEMGRFLTVGCSYKGRIWSREQGSIRGFVDWCDEMGEKLLDDTYNTQDLINSSLISIEVSKFPKTKVLGVVWPKEFYEKDEEKVVFRCDSASFSLLDCSIEPWQRKAGDLRFAIVCSDRKFVYSISISKDGNLVITCIDGESLKIQIGRTEYDAEKWFQENPPEFVFVDGSGIDGKKMICPINAQQITIPDGNFEARDWAGVNLKSESMWKGTKVVSTSVQFKVAKQLEAENFDIIFNDDGAGESADLVGIKNKDSHIELVLLHCKYSKGKTSGARVADVVEVCSQAVRSYKWKNKELLLFDHLQHRYEKTKKNSSKNRFFKGTLNDLIYLRSLLRKKEVKYFISIVQPGLSYSKLTSEQRAILGSTHAFLLETTDANMKVICSA